MLAPLFLSAALLASIVSAANVVPVKKCPGENFRVVNGKDEHL